jgi:hypothetical protein
MNRHSRSRNPDGTEGRCTTSSHGGPDSLRGREEGSAPGAALRAKPGSPPLGGTCRAEIVRLESALSRARASRQLVGSAPESSAARLHRQPTPQSVAQATTEAEKGIETALLLARKLESEGMEPECTAMLKEVELPSGIR